MTKANAGPDADKRFKERLDFRDLATLCVLFPALAAPQNRPGAVKECRRSGRAPDQRTQGLQARGPGRCPRSRGFRGVSRARRRLPRPCSGRLATRSVGRFPPGPPRDAHPLLVRSSPLHPPRAVTPAGAGRMLASVAPEPESVLDSRTPLLIQGPPSTSHFKETKYPPSDAAKLKDTRCFLPSRLPLLSLSPHF